MNAEVVSLRSDWLAAPRLVRAIVALIVARDVIAEVQVGVATQHSSPGVHLSAASLIVTSLVGEAIELFVASRFLAARRWAWIVLLVFGALDLVIPAIELAVHPSVVFTVLNMPYGVAMLALLTRPAVRSWINANRPARRLFEPAPLAAPLQPDGQPMLSGSPRQLPPPLVVRLMVRQGHTVSGIAKQYGVTAEAVEVALATQDEPRFS